MNVHITSSLRRIAAALLLAAGLGGCAVYAPPYAYDGNYPVYNYPTYNYPTYIGPPIALDLGFGYYKGPRHGHYRHHHHHGWRGHGGRGPRGGWGHHRGWRGGHGRH